MALETHGIEELTQFAVDVIQSSGEQALSFYGKGDPGIKFDERLVTEAELHLMEFFNAQLSARFPEHQAFKNNLEEKGYSHEENRYLWVYDPIDGVANFLAGIPVWGISLALLENFWPVLGMFYMPATGDLFHAQAGHDAFWGKRKISTSSQENIDDESLLLTYSRFHNHYRCTFPGKVRNMGCSAAHICYVAMGRAEATVLANESYQDLAAVRIILEAAGGKFFRMNGGEFFLNEYLNGERVKDHLLVVAPDILAQVRRHLQILE